MDPNQVPQQQPPQGYPPQPPQGGMIPPNPGKGLGIAGMVCGIVAVVICWFLPIAPIIIAVIGLVLSGLGMKKSKEVNAPAGMAIAGLVCSIVALVPSVICTICICSTAATLGGIGAGLGALDW